ncbi:hypothetical protein [Peptostreptococcus porci]|uniref:hypothetical protein n=1 Tax=Peptostreptococcus porci TaxID=2652282 RepID=UPI002A813FD6|nr:hypothetical protein [Peptostreptococcus porci]MDY4128823.1 hypothetical protein [Peptostreptococcus porci]
MKVLLEDLGKIDRAKKGKVYKAGTVFIGMSATRGGDVHYLDEDGEIESKYATVEFNGKYNSKYIYYAILSEHNRWINRYIQHINVTISDLKAMEINIITDINKQNEIVNKLDLLDSWIENEERLIYMWKNIKKSSLEKMLI